jgi:hypothetical protein
MLTGLGPRTSVRFLLGAHAVFGFGFALVSPPIANTAVSGMAPAQAGVAAAVATTSRQRGYPWAWPCSAPSPRAVWAARSGPVCARHTARLVDRGRSGLAVAALGYLTTTSWARGTARRTAERLEEPNLREREPRQRAVGAPAHAISAR